jgi:hypothetical protein
VLLEIWKQAINKVTSNLVIGGEENANFELPIRRKVDGFDDIIVHAKGDDVNASDS